MSNPFYDPKTRIHLRTGEQAYKDYSARVKSEKSKPVKKTRNTKTKSNLILNPSNFIKLSTFTLDGNPINMLVGKYAAQVTQEIQEALNSLGYLPQIKDAQNNITQKGYTQEDIWINNRLGSLNWYEQIPLFECLGYDRMDNRQSLDFIILLKNGLDGKAAVTGGDDKQLERDEIKDILDKLSKKESPWRSEYSDAGFQIQGDKIIMHSGHYTNPSLSLQERIKPENIQHKYAKEIPKNNIIMQDGWTKFDNYNKEGLCTKLEKSNEIHNWFPRNNAVAGLAADSDGFCLYCDGGPLSSDSGLGMRFAKILG